MRTQAWGPDQVPRAGGAARAVAAGVAGVAAVTILNEAGRKVLREAPRVELLGKRAVGRLARKAGFRPNDRERYLLALAGEVASNGAYYALAAAARRRSLGTGALLGALAGAGAVALPPMLGLGRWPTRRTARTQALTFGWYLAAGLAAGAVARALGPRKVDWTF
jgi:hypothetical protein